MYFMVSVTLLFHLVQWFNSEMHFVSDFCSNETSDIWEPKRKRIIAV